MLASSARRNLLKTVQRNRGLEASWCMTPPDLFLLQFTHDKHAEAKIVAEKWCSSWSRVFAVKVNSSTQSAMALWLYGNEVARLLLRDCRAYEQMRNEANYKDGSDTSMFAFDGLVATVVRHLTEREKCKGHRWNGYGSTYARMVETATAQTNEIVKKFVKLCPSHRFTREEYVLNRNRNVWNITNIEVGD